MIGILDYGMGNLASVFNGFRKVGYEALIIERPESLEEISGLVLPGVGAFGDAISHLESSGMRGALVEFIKSGEPFLGFCLGMQLLFSVSEERGEHRGLNIVKGVVKRLTGDVKIPHMGWNKVEQKKADNPIFRGIPEGSRFYFVHSYHCVPEDEEWVAAYTPYGNRFVSALAKDNVWAFQCHPEKSSSIGLALLSNFGSICEGGV